MKPEEAVERGLLDLKQEVADERKLLPSACLFLKNVVQEEELKKDEDFDEIFTDIKLECEQCSGGKVIELIIPRPSENQDLPDPDGLGYAFVKFENLTQATKAKRMMSGRKFGDNAVEVEFFSVKKFDAKELKDPTPNTDAPEIEGHGEEDMALEDGQAGDGDTAATNGPGADGQGATPLAPPPPVANGDFVD
jgi:splicing factor U2AF subunit